MLVAGFCFQQTAHVSFRLFTADAIAVAEVVVLHRFSNGAVLAVTNHPGVVEPSDLEHSTALR